MAVSMFISCKYTEFAGVFIAFIICLGEVGVTSARPLPWKVEWSVQE
jgi:hypothetical protein